MKVCDLALFGITSSSHRGKPARRMAAVFFRLTQWYEPNSKRADQPKSVRGSCDF